MVKMRAACSSGKSADAVPYMDAAGIDSNLHIPALAKDNGTVGDLGMGLVAGITHYQIAAESSALAGCVIAHARSHRLQISRSFHQAAVFVTYQCRYILKRFFTGIYLCQRFAVFNKLSRSYLTGHSYAFAVDFGTALNHSITVCTRAAVVFYTCSIGAGSTAVIFQLAQVDAAYNDVAASTALIDRHAVKAGRCQRAVAAQAKSSTGDLKLACRHYSRRHAAGKGCHFRTCRTAVCHAGSSCLQLANRHSICFCFSISSRQASCSIVNSCFQIVRTFQQTISTVADRCFQLCYVNIADCIIAAVFLQQHTVKGLCTADACCADSYAVDAFHTAYFSGFDHHAVHCRFSFIFIVTDIGGFGLQIADIAGIAAAAGLQPGNIITYIF